MEIEINNKASDWCRWDSNLVRPGHQIDQQHQPGRNIKKKKKNYMTYNIKKNTLYDVQISVKHTSLQSLTNENIEKNYKT